MKDHPTFKVFFFLKLYCSYFHINAPPFPPSPTKKQQQTKTTPLPPHTHFICVEILQCLCLCNRPLPIGYSFLKTSLIENAPVHIFMPSVPVERSFITTGKLVSSPSRKRSVCSPMEDVLFGQSYSQIAHFFMICRVDSSSFILIVNRPVLFYCFIFPNVCHDQSLSLVHGGRYCCNL